MLKDEFELLLQHDWDESTVVCIKDMHANLKMYKMMISKYTIENISNLLKLANHIKTELDLIKEDLIETQEENERLRHKISELKYLELQQKNFV